MKKIYWIIGGVIAAAAAVYFFVIKKKVVTLSAQAQVKQPQLKTPMS